MRKSFFVVLVLAVVLVFSCTALAASSYQFSFYDPQRLYYQGSLPAGYYNFRWVNDSDILTFADPVYYDGGDVSDYSALVLYMIDGEVVDSISLSFRFGLLGDATVIMVDSSFFIEDSLYYLDFVPPAVSVPSVDLAADISVLSGFFDNFGIGTLLSFVAAGISVSVGLVLLWFGFRYLIRKITGALRRGRV